MDSLKRKQEKQTRYPLLNPKRHWDDEIEFRYSNQNLCHILVPVANGFGATKALSTSEFRILLAGPLINPFTEALCNWFMLQRYSLMLNHPAIFQIFVWETKIYKFNSLY